MPISRREFVHTTLAAGVGFGVKSAVADEPSKQRRNDESLAGEVGITTSSLSGHLSATPAKGKFTLLELPKVLRDELGMRVIDLNTSTLASTEPAYLERVRKAADDAGCVLTNLKLNQRGSNMDSPDREVRERALREYERSIEVAAALGCRWARPLPRKEQPDRRVHVDSYRRLCDHAAKHGVRMLVENYGWMEDDPQSVVALVRDIDRSVEACPDTGNWKNDEIRFAGLAATFPIAVTCDFKARELGPNGEHERYDLKRCFEIGWQAGFRGPWCLEHANADRAALFRELALLRDMLRTWSKQAPR